MATYIFNGECPSGIKQAFIDAYKLQPANDKLRLVVETTSNYKKSGIYSAERDDTSKPIVIDWGDGTVEQVNGDVSQKIHTYASVGTFNVVVENIKSYVASDNNYGTISQNNKYTLKEVIAMPDSVTSIGDGAFYGCSGLTSVIIPNSVMSIGSYAFHGCSGLMSVTIPNSVTSIGEGAFSDCSGLTSVTIPDGVTSIGDRAFLNCSGLMSIVVGENNPNYSSRNCLLLSKDGKTLVQGVNGTVTIPDGVTSIRAYALYGCSGLTSVVIPDSVTSIGQWAFAFCYNSDGEGLTSVTIGSGIISIEQSAFYMGTTQQILQTFTINKPMAYVNAMSPAPSMWFYTEVGIPGSQTITCTDGSFIVTWSCLLKGTDILLTDNTTKKIEDLTYNDTLKVWDFDEGQLGSAKVCWLTRPGLKSNHYYQLTFDNGTVLKTTGINSNHRIFSVDQSKFTNVCDAKVGDKVFSIDGTLTITDVKYVEEECEYYNVMTSGKINCFANGILTSDRYGNLYPIVDMKYVKDGRTIRPYSEYEAVGIDRYWYDNLRLGENTETVEKSKEYVWKCLGQMLPLPETKN